MQKSKDMHQGATGHGAWGVVAESSFQLELHERSASRGAPEIPVLRKIEETATHSELFKRLARHPRVIEIAQALLNSNDLVALSK